MLEVLLVDNESAILNGLTMAIDWAAQGCRIRGTACNGAEALEKMAAHQPDIVISDIRMPEMNGLDATRIIKEVASDVPIIALSAYAFEEDISAAKAAGCDDFLAKPFQIEELIDTIERHLK